MTTGWEDAPSEGDDVGAGLLLAGHGVLCGISGRVAGEMAA